MNDPSQILVLIQPLLFPSHDNDRRRCQSLLWYKVERICAYYKTDESHAAWTVGSFSNASLFSLKLGQNNLLPFSFYIKGRKSGVSMCLSAL
jgi:hypothetical protein